MKVETKQNMYYAPRMILHSNNVLGFTASFLHMNLSQCKENGVWDSSKLLFFFFLFFYIQYKQQIHSLSYILTCGNTEFYLVHMVLSGQSIQGQAT